MGGPGWKLMILTLSFSCLQQGRQLCCFLRGGLGGGEAGVLGLIMEQELGGQALPQGIWHLLPAPV